jgi:hypothetical protein
MGRTCGTYGVEEIHRILVDKPEGNEPLGELVVDRRIIIK